jgi:uncharacterized protein YjiK
MSRWPKLLLSACVAVIAVAARPATSRRQGSALLDKIDFRQKAAVQSRLPRALQEISGLAVTSDGRVFAHGDEHAVVVQVDPCSGKVVKAFSLGAPPVRGDFEGIAIIDQRFFLVTSRGLLYEFREGADGAVVRFNIYDTGFGRVCEIEGLAYEPGSRVLLIGCKQPVRREIRPTVTVLRWSLDRLAAADPPSLTIPLGDVTARLKGKGFHTSAIERDAKSGNYLLLAGPQHSLVEVTSTGTVLAARELHRQQHPQPEGLTLLGDSVMVIADEGGGGRATITCYRRMK